MGERPAVWTGLLVAFLGLLPLAWLVARPEDPGVSPEATVAQASPAPPTSPASIGGLDPSVSKLLDAAGSVTVVGESDLPGVAPEIVRVLISFDVPLLLPVETSAETSP
jgi:hypothetical protein